MADDPKTLSRRSLLTFWRRPEEKPAPEPEPYVEPRRPWPRDRMQGKTYGHLLPLRPPGNMQEYILREACTRCNKCEEACPADAIFMLGSAWGAAEGTPAIDARAQPCVLCEDYKCTKVCPSGALQPVYSTAEIKMGAAQVDTARCLTYHGQSCGKCISVCPVPGAIFGDPQDHPLVDEYTCVGCGLCVRECPTEPTSIVVVPRD